jgi:hypothetical protein
MSDSHDVLTLRGTARLCRIRPATVTAAVRARKIPSRRRGNRILIKRTDALRMWAVA